MSEIINVKFEKKFESVDIKLTYKEAQLLYWLKCRAIFCSKEKVNFQARRYSIDLTEQEYQEFCDIANPLEIIL